MYIFDCFYIRHITINSLAIPDTFCSPVPGSGYQCPLGMKCMKLNLSKYIMGFNGFEEFCEWLNTPITYKFLDIGPGINIDTILSFIIFSHKYFHSLSSFLPRRLGLHNVQSN